MSEIVEVIGDTIYVVDTPTVAPSAVTALYSKIDWLELAKQKRCLVLRICKDEDGLPEDEGSPLWGLVNLIDTIQDDAEQRGYPVVYGYDLEMYKEEHPDAEIPDGNENQAQH